MHTYYYLLKSEHKKGCSSYILKEQPLLVDLIFQQRMIPFYAENITSINFAALRNTLSLN